MNHYEIIDQQPLNGNQFFEREYELCKSRNGKDAYTIDGHTYTFSEWISQRTIIAARCERKHTCRARAYLNPTTQMCTGMLHEHNHMQSEAAMSIPIQDCN
jgi:hypothetical protein